MWANKTRRCERATPQTLGCTSTICCDKTGTLTTNQMAVRELVLPASRVLGGGGGGGEGEGPVNWRVMEVQGSSFDFTPSAGGLVCEGDRSDLERFDVR